MTKNNKYLMPKKIFISFIITVILGILGICNLIFVFTTISHQGCIESIHLQIGELIAISLGISAMYYVTQGIKWQKEDSSQE